MDLRNGDCLTIMEDLETDSVDLLFADLPYGQTSCKWDCLIDLNLFWKQVNRVCKPEAAMIFTCTVKFGNTLINSNPKNFRYDLIWCKSASTSFLNAKKMPMRKHEMIYVFYNKLPKVYTENIALHHKHKFLKEDKEKYMESDLYGNGGKDTQNKSTRKHKILYKKSEYVPPLPNSVIKEDTGVYKKPIESDKKYGIYGSYKEIDFNERKNGESRYEPKLPTSVVKEDEIFIRGKKKSSTNKDVYNSSERFNNGKLYHHNRKLQKGDESIYDPPLPNSVIKEDTGVDEDYDNRVIKPRNTLKKEETYGKEYLDKKINFRKYNKKLGGKGEEGHLYEPKLPTSVIKEDTGVYNECDHSSSKKLVRDTKNYKNESVLYGEIERPDFMRKNGESMYDPKLPNSILEVKSEKGKHATQKPVALMEWILKYYSREGEVVLDPTMGSGSMGVACANKKRLFIGIEKDETIYNVAFERCQDLF